MAKITNISNGPRGAYLKGGVLVMAEAGEAIEGDFDDVNDEWFEEGEGGLSSLSVADLKALAADEAIDLGDATKKADIIAAIELGREKN